MENIVISIMYFSQWGGFNKGEEGYANEPKAHGYYVILFYLTLIMRLTHKVTNMV